MILTVTKVDSRFEVRVISKKGNHKFAAKRRFKTRKEADELRDNCLFLKKHGSQYVKRYLDGEEIQDIKKDAENPLENIGSGGMTFGDALGFWKKNIMQTFSPGWKKNIPGYERQFEKLMPLPIASITRSFLTEIATDLRNQGNAPKTINIKIGWIQSVLNYSVQNNLLNYSPASGLKKEKVPRAKIEFWRPHEVQAFLDFANVKYPRSSPERFIFVLYLTALSTGVRAGELYAIKPVKLGDGEILIDQQWDMVAKDFRETKTDKDRYVPLSNELEHELSLLKSQLSIKNHQVFFSFDGAPIDHDKMSDIFEADQKAAGVKRIKFHALRHTAATMMLRSGVVVNVVQNILGHSTMDMTMRYVHALEDDVKKAASIYELKAKPALKIV